MSTILRANGTTEEVMPANGKDWTLDEMQKIVGGYIEIVQANAKPGYLLVVNEEGALRDMAPNGKATELYGPTDMDALRELKKAGAIVLGEFPVVIRGDVLLCPAGEIE